MSEKGQSRKSMFSALKNMEELRRLYDSDTPVLAYEFKRRMVEGWTPEHSHHRGPVAHCFLPLFYSYSPTPLSAWSKPCFPSELDHDLEGFAIIRSRTSGVLM